MTALILAIAVLFAASNHGALEKADLGNPDTYATCAQFDVASTAFGLAVDGMHEINPLTKALTIPALGHVAGTVVPVIGLSVATYYILKALNAPKVTATMAGLTCFSAARNLYLIR